MMYYYHNELLDLQEKLLEAEEQRIRGVKTFSLDEASEKLEDIINGADSNYL